MASSLGLGRVPLLVGAASDPTYVGLGDPGEREPTCEQAGKPCYRRSDELQPARSRESNTLTSGFSRIDRHDDSRHVEYIVVLSATDPGAMLWLAATRWRVAADRALEPLGEWAAKHIDQIRAADAG